MLTYRVNEKHLSERRKAIESSIVDIVDYTELKDDESYNNDRLVYVFESNDLEHLEELTTISCVHNFNLNYIKIPVDRHLEEFSVEEKFDVLGFDNKTGVFSISVDKYVELNLVEAQSVSHSGLESDGIVILRFNKRHFFDCDISKPNILHFMGGDFNEVVSIEANFLDYKTMSIPFTDLIATADGETLYEMLFGGTVFVEKIVTDSPFVIYRDNYRFSGKGQHQFYLETISYSIPLGLSNSFCGGLLQEEQVRTNFVDNVIESAIPSVTDFEKDVYKPAIYKRDKNGDLVKLSDVFKITFNLHFREHRGVNWECSRDSYWNGVVKKNGKFVVDKNLTSDNRGDLLGYLGMSNSDVYFQKNKLTKTFLRLSFYDNPNPLKQNLYAYSTVFFDGGDAFKKYIKNRDLDMFFESVNINGSSGEYSYDKKKKKGSISVTREYIPSDNETDDDIDTHRLSARFVVEDKNETISSSEGFYIYTWKDKETNNIPKSLYMKVEFNHAGYGKTIPFMMPFWDIKKHSNKIGVKTFSEIVADFDDVAFEENKRDGVYGMQQYNKYSYIYLKYIFDKADGRYSYFLDPDVYGNIKNSDELVFNLYEAKVGKRYK